MKTLTEKFLKQVPEVVLTSGMRLVENQSVSPELTSDESFSAIIADEFESSLTLENKQLVGRCSCASASVCSHLVALLFTAESFGDLSLALKRNIKSVIVLPTLDLDGVSQEVSYTEVVSQEITPLKPREPEHWEGFPEEQSTVIDQIKALKKGLKSTSAPKSTLEINYIISLEDSSSHELVVQVYWRSQKSDGSWSKRSKVDYSQGDVPADSEVFNLIGSSWKKPKSRALKKISTLSNVFRLPPPVAHLFLKQVVDKGTLYARFSAEDTRIFKLDGGKDWVFSFAFDESEITGNLQCGSQTIALQEPLLISEGRFFITNATVEWLEDYDAFKYMDRLCHEETIVVEGWEREDWVKTLLIKTNYPASELPVGFNCQVNRNTTPKPQIHIQTAKYKYRGKEQLQATVEFNYRGAIARELSSNSKVALANGTVLFERDSKEEACLSEQLNSIGFRFNDSNGREEYGWKLLPTALDAAVQKLIKHDWTVTAHGKSYLKPQDMGARLTSSGMDWFELKGEVDFGSEVLPLPELLKAAKKGQEYVRLGDGSFGILPLHWLANFTALSEIGLQEGDGYKFRKSQSLILDEFLAKAENVNVSQTLEQSVQAIESFESVLEVEPPTNFRGELRPYQKTGLAWMLFLQKMGFGGILADDMGLGKTVQILALLANRTTGNPSLVVAPKSLMFNWFAEAEKFTPHLKVLIHSGASRDKSGRTFSNYDLILTTYGTLVRDVTHFQTPFDYAILDESQAIKNEKTENFKAVTALNCQHRLCLSGTPIENSMSELFSQFNFLNPGFINNSTVLKQATSENAVNASTISKVKKALLPFILRRVKEEVAKDLPAKTEQILYCEMGEEQQQKYDEIKEYYRNQLLIDSDEKGAGGIQVLAALLRLRQMACHPGLIDPDQTTSPSVKLDVLMSQVDELVAEGHKVLIFSQFRSFLQLVRQQLEYKHLKYAYIDGTVKDRAAEVDYFQNNKEVSTFLISLKAGGVGLNLTEADYVFILDPWWNPSAEAQAVDRAYRIGQKRNVFAYRMICKGTVEEKILEIKQRKQKVADSLINDTPLSVSDLSKEDLHHIFS